MSYKKNVAWSQLKVGMIAITSITLFALTIFLITGGTNFFGETMILNSFSSDAGGLRVGAPVRLAGVDVGMVREVSLSGREARAEAVQIVFEVNAKYAGDFREDSRAILAAEGLLGERYVNISKGSPDSPQIPPGGTLLFRETPEFSELVGGSRDLLDNLNVLTTRLNTVVESIETGQGTIGKLITDDTLYQRLNTAVGSAEQLITDISGGKGSLGQLVISDEFYRRVNDTMMKVDRTAARIDSGEGTLGKLINDPALYQEAQQLMARSSTLVTNINNGQGTLGKLATDDEFYNRLNNAVRSVDTVMTGINNGEGTMGKLFKDQSLYNNLNLTTGEVKELMGDFRRNPKKFLTIQLKIF